MKKNLRLLCLGLASAIFACGFAQVDNTSLLKNADMEQGLRGWSFEGINMGKNTKDVNFRKVGFHGMSQGVQEAWDGNGEPLNDGYVMQRVKNLPDGTYVFGAYAAASKQGTEESNRETIKGVTLFANDATVKVATDNPDRAEKGEDYKWAHASKFNVATKVTDGTLFVGLKVEETNANYVVWDNATLYYFADMDEAAALDAMARIDMDSAIAIADTLVLNNIKMNKDSLDNLEEAIETAKNSLEEVTAETLWEDSENLFFYVGLARRSMTDYANLKKAIDFAYEVKAGDWSQNGLDFYGKKLDDALAKAEKIYNEAKKERDDVEEARNELNEAAKMMRVDAFDVAKAALEAFINKPNTFTNAPGGYTDAQKEKLEAYNEELNAIVRAVEDEEEGNIGWDGVYELAPEVNARLAEVVNDPIPLEYTELPIHLTPSAEKIDGHAYIEGAFKTADNFIQYNSPKYRFATKVDGIRFTVKHCAWDKSYFCLSELAFYDGAGNKIELTENDITSNAEMGALNNGNMDGSGGIPALLDDDKNTHFQSSWIAQPANGAEHYIQVALPNGGYDMFSFTMISRNGQNVIQFPADMTVSLVSNTRDNLMTKLDQAKSFAPQVGTEVGFLTGDENPDLFANLNAAILEAEDLLANKGDADDMNRVADALNTYIFNYQQLDAVKKYVLPDPDKKYRIVSAYPEFLSNQHVEKTITVNKSDSAFWWSNVDLDSLQQEFIFEPYVNDRGKVIYETKEEKVNIDGEETTVPYAVYCYKLKHVQTGWYVDSAFVDTEGELALIYLAEKADTVKIRPLGRGQWSITVKDNPFHAGDHNGGVAANDKDPEKNKGAYGGIKGVASGIVVWGGGLDSQSSWFIREVSATPYKLSALAGAYKSGNIHFEGTNVLKLTADKACAFEGLALYDICGMPIKFSAKAEDSNAVVITTESAIATCAVAFNNKENVAEVTFETLEPEFEEKEDDEEEEDMMPKLETKYNNVVAYAPEEGTGVGQYADLTEYTAAVEAAEAILESGAANNDIIKGAIAQLDSAIAHLKNPHLPEADKYYFIYSGKPEFYANHGFDVAFSTVGEDLWWAHENELDSALCWTFEPATIEELEGLGLDSASIAKCLTINDNDTIVNAYYIKNLGNGMYVGYISSSEWKQHATILMVEDKVETTPYKVTILNNGSDVALDNLVTNMRLHAKDHGNGSNRSGQFTYYTEGANTPSSWNIIEVAEPDFILNTEIDLVEVEPVKVVKGIYDLFGRRLDAPAAPGIYIIDGVKRVIK